MRIATIKEPPTTISIWLPGSISPANFRRKVEPGTVMSIVTYHPVRFLRYEIARLVCLTRTRRKFNFQRFSEFWQSSRMRPTEKGSVWSADLEFSSESRTARVAGKIPAILINVRPNAKLILLAFKRLLRIAFNSMLHILLGRVTNYLVRRKISCEILLPITVRNWHSNRRKKKLEFLDTF